MDSIIETHSIYRQNIKFVVVDRTACMSISIWRVYPITKHIQHMYSLAVQMNTYCFYK